MTIAKHARGLLLRSIKTQPSVYEFLRYRIYARFRSFTRKRIFRDIYETNAWGNNFSASGPGSSLQSTYNVRKALPLLIDALRARSFLDVPCGDFQWMRHVALGVDRYYGADIVVSMIDKNRAAFGDRGEFLCLDLLRDRLPSADILFCRDCFIHLSFIDISLAINNIMRSAPTYLLTTTFPDHERNVDTVTPYWRPINLQLPPFNFPPPLHLIADCSPEHCHGGKYLGVWAMRDIGLNARTALGTVPFASVGKQVTRQK
jgi:hypothetical protein